MRTCLTITSLVLLLITPPLLAHTPVCRCELRQQQITCTGAYDDGSSASDVTLRVILHDGTILHNSVLDKHSQFRFTLPQKPFYVLMDAGPGEMVDIEWQDIKGMPAHHFPDA